MIKIIERGILLYLQLPWVVSFGPIEVVLSLTEDGSVRTVLGN